MLKRLFINSSSNSRLFTLLVPFNQNLKTVFDLDATHISISLELLEMLGLWASLSDAPALSTHMSRNMIVELGTVISLQLDFRFDLQYYIQYQNVPQLLYQLIPGIP